MYGKRVCGFPLKHRDKQSVRSEMCPDTGATTRLFPSGFRDDLAMMPRFFGDRAPVTSAP
jgi:hypothetical protein